MKRSPLVALLLVLCLALSARAQDGTELIAASDLLQIRQLGDVQVSPDGRSVVYTVRQAVEEVQDGDTTYTYRTHLYLAPATGRDAPRALTHGRQSASQPDWHPDGDRLAFVRTVDGQPQVFVLPLTGGEAYQLTEAPHGASAPRWSPDGSRLLYASSLPARAVHDAGSGAPAWPTEQAGRTPQDTAGARPDPDGSLAEVRAWLARNRAEEDPAVMERLDFQGEYDLDPELSYRHLYVVPVTDSAAVQRPTPTALTRGYYSFGGGAWMADGERVVVSGTRQTAQHPDRVRQTRLYVAGASGRSFDELLAMEGYALGAPTPAPEGSAVAFVAQALDDPGYAQSELGVYDPSEGGPARLLTEAFDRSVGAPRWSPDGWFLYTVAPSNGAFPLYRVAPFAEDRPAPAGVPTDTTALAADAVATDTTALAGDSLALAGEAVAEETGPALERLTSYQRGVRSFDVSRATIFYVVTEVTNPYELYARSTQRSARERRLTSHNASWLQDKRLSRPEVFTVRRDSVEIQAWMMRPATYENGRRYPLLVEIHGGPMAMWGPGEATMWHEFQFFAARGYGIVYSNPRGSGGYGRAFKAANYRDWGVTPAGDVLAAARLAAAEPWVDQSRQVVTGGSYAGYLTAWIVAHDDRFQAAAAQRGVYDLPTFFGEGNAWRLVPYHFGGYPWEDDAPVPSSTAAPPADRTDTSAVAAEDALTDTSAVALTAAPDAMQDRPAADTLVGLSPYEALRRNSPFTYVDQITTPLLIIHASQDLRTGVSQSEMLYRALKVLERPVEYVRYPDAGHDLSRTGDPRQRMDRILRIYEWFERFLDENAATATN